MKVSTRAEWGWDPSTLVRRNVDPRGVTWHYPGPGRFRFADHAACLRQVKAWDAQHRARGSNGLEYCWVVCQHGYFIEARSTWAQMIARPGSNGTTAANSVRVTGQFMAGTLDAPPTQQEYAWMGEATAHARSQGAGSIVDGHRDHYATACPGDPIYSNLGTIARYAATPTTTPTTPPSLDGDDVYLARRADTGQVFLIGPAGATYLSAQPDVDALVALGLPVKPLAAHQIDAAGVLLARAGGTAALAAKVDALTAKVDALTPVVVPPKA